MNKDKAYILHLIEENERLQKANATLAKRNVAIFSVLDDYYQGGKHCKDKERTKHIEIIYREFERRIKE